MFLHALKFLRAFCANFSGCFSIFAVAWFCFKASAADGDLNSNRSFAVQPTGRNVSVIAKAPDGKLVVAGPISSINGEKSRKVVRFYQNGAVDPTFICSDST